MSDVEVSTVVGASQGVVAIEPLFRHRHKRLRAWFSA